MVFRLPRLPQLLHARTSAVFGGVIIAMLWGGIALKYWGDRQADYREAERTVQNFAMLLEESVLRTIGEIDKALLYLRRMIETRPDGTGIQPIVATTDLLSETILQVSVIDADGVLRASNAIGPTVPPFDLSDRVHYRVHVDSDEDQLFISRPMVGRASRKWTVQFTRRLVDREKRFAGVVVVSLDPGHLTRFYERIDLGAAASVSLIGSDGIVRSSGGAAAQPLGRDMKDTAFFRVIQAGQDAVFTVGEGTAARLVAARQVRDHPLWVKVAMPDAQIYRSSRNTLRWLALAGLALTLIILAAVRRIMASEAKARQKAEQLQLTLEHMRQGIMLVTPEGRIPIINRRCAELIELPPELIDNPPPFRQLAAQYLSRGEALETGGGEVRGAVVTTGARRLPNGRVLEIRRSELPGGGFVQTFSDVTKRANAEADAARLAAEDPLTGLPNRRVFAATLDEIGRRRAAASDAAAFAVLFLDLDRFKLVNDTLGHRLGDRLLKEMGRRLKAAVGGEGLVARLGGDEFAVIVPDASDACALAALATRLGEALSAPCPIDDQALRTGVSIGIAVGPSDGTTSDDLLMAADLALYAVKARGRGGYQFYDRSMNKALHERRQIEVDLREAIERRTLTLHYQPIVDLRSNRIIGFEALARWHHPTRGVVPPSAFIPVAEDSGLILPLGEWALREACHRATQWPNGMTVAVNLSPAQFTTPDLVERVDAILRETGLAPARLELEITERLFLESNEHTLSTLHRLKALGVRIALDDFGTGYSSLSYLQSFPFDKIKIDRAFVSTLAEGTEHLVIVQAVVSIARALGMATTAEGVETADQRHYLTALGCGQAQGYLFGPPVAVEKIFTVIDEWSARKTKVA